MTDPTQKNISTIPDSDISFIVHLNNQDGYDITNMSNSYKPFKNTNVCFVYEMDILDYTIGTSFKWIQPIEKNETLFNKFFTGLKEKDSELNKWVNRNHHSPLISKFPKIINDYFLKERNRKIKSILD